MGEFTPRERVAAAVGHQEADRIAISFGGTSSTGILECPPDGKNYTRLCHYLGIRDFEKPDIGYAFNAVGNIDERILQKFGSDLRRINPNPVEFSVAPDGTKTVYGIRCGLRVKKMGLYEDIFEFPLRHATSKKDIETYPLWPTEDDLAELARGKTDEAKRLREETDYAVMADGYLTSFPFLMYSLLAGYEKWFVDMKLNPKFYFALCDKLLEIGFAIVDRFLGAVGDYIDMVATYDDMGTQQGLLCSHQDYVKFIKPYERQMIGHIKKYTGATIYRHSCGSVYDIIPDLIEIGVEVLNPVQPLAKNMEPWRLKKEFGKDLTFCGGIDIQRLLPCGSPAQVREAVKKTIDTYGPGGGYILGPSHNIEPDTPPENIVAMYEAAQEYGNYPVA